MNGPGRAWSGADLDEISVLTSSRFLLTRVHRESRATVEALERLIAAARPGAPEVAEVAAS